MRYLADTNILLRIADSSSVQHLSAAQAVAKLYARNDKVFLAPQVLTEFWVVASRPTKVNGLGWPVDTVQRIVAKLLDEFVVLTETPDLFPEWHRLVVQYRVIGKQAHDARLVAIMNINGFSHLLTFNANNFQRYPLTVATPDGILAT